jgi:hypothetical protein
MRLTDANVQELGPDGSFAIAGIPPGTHPVELLLPVTQRRNGLSSSRRIGPTLAMVDVRDGERVERTLEVTDFPGSVALDVRVDGEAIPGLGIELSALGGDERSKVFGDTQTAGRCVLRAFPGTWSVDVHDPDFGWRAADVMHVEVLSARQTSAVVQISLAEATLVFRDATTGAPLARRWISLLGAETGSPDDDSAWKRVETDDAGRVTWTLASGEYRFRLDPGEHLPLFPAREPALRRIAPITWTVAGPLVREVQL